MVSAREISLEAEEWYVLCNWLRSHENRLQYALRPRSHEWEQIYELRQSIERQLEDIGETRGVLQSASLSESEVNSLLDFLRRRSRRLRFLPWRDRERRDVVRLRRQLLDQL